MTPRKRPSLGPRVGNIRKDLTPETLRALADDPHFPVDGFWHSQLRAHAAAWKADRRKLEALERDLRIWHDAVARDANNDRQLFVHERNGMRMALAAFHQYPTLMDALAAGEEK